MALALTWPAHDCTKEEQEKLKPQLRWAKAAAAAAAAASVRAD